MYQIFSNTWCKGKWWLGVVSGTWPRPFK